MYVWCGVHWHSGGNRPCGCSNATGLFILGGTMDLDALFGEGWSIYLWLVMGALIIIAAIYWIRWAYKNEQFDEDIKYVIFDEDDKDKMDPEEYKKSREVIAKQIKRREEVLKEQEEERRKNANG